MRVLVTGGSGFIGSNFIRMWIAKYPKDTIVNIDNLSTAGRVSTTKDFATNKNYTFIKGDICDSAIVHDAMKGVDYVVNFAAESHNDRALQDPKSAAMTNVIGVQTLCEEALKARIKRFHQVSTCEVYGDLSLDENRAFKENDPYVPRTPYNAAKAGGDHIALAYFHSFGLPVTVSHCANNLGPYQFPEKLIPRFVTNLMDNVKLPLYKSSQNRREWIDVDDHNEALHLILTKGRIGELYNLGSGVEKSVEEIADSILAFFKRDQSWKKYVPDRLGHDRRYLMDSTKIRNELKWKPRYSFEESINRTILWYHENEWWWRPLKKEAESLYKKTKQV